MLQLEQPIKAALSERFTICKLLGKGSFGNVYQCIDLKDNFSCAVKVISKLNVKENKIETLKEEAKLLKSLNHNNIVKIYEYGEFQSCIFIKMDIAKKGNLRIQLGIVETLIDLKKIKNESIHQEDASRIMGQIFMGVSYIHSLNIIHRDIKPQNILLTEENGSEVIKIADFGLSTKLNFHYPKSAIAKCGTLLFMAPQILCKYSYTKAIDVWSASTIMFFLFNRCHPIWKDTMSTEEYSTIMSKIKELPLLKNASQLAQDFFNRISKIDPHERYSAQEGLKHPWITRKLNDQIPLAVHQSYSSFATGSQISKCLIMVRNVYSQKLPEVPFQYREKIFIRSSRAPSKERNSTFNKLTKLKSMNFEKESSSELMLEAVNDKTSLSRTKMKLLPQHDQENPAINKLNQIFNTLFDKKITSKKQIILQEKKSPLKEFFSDPVQNYQFKDKIEKEIERAVDDVIQKNKYKRKRILPTGASKLPTINGDLEPKRELNSVHKVNFMKKTKIKKRNTTDFN